MPLSSKNAGLILGIAAILAIVSFIIGFFISKNLTRPANPTALTIQAPNQTIKVDVADTPALRERGLSGRTSIAADEGMLFDFESSGNYGFWMKEMNFPLDMVWIDDQKRVVGVTERISPSTYPEVFYPVSPSKYVLELNSGKAGQFGIATGTVLEF